ncbi:PIGR protein, partial [Amia calva]|nr:PIGR protein [Amia calva]
METLLLLLLAKLAGGSGRPDPVSVTGAVGGSVSVRCGYNEGDRALVKYWCRGTSLPSCETVSRSDSAQRETDRVSIRDDQSQGVFTVTVRRLEREDAGEYWCAVNRTGLLTGVCHRLTLLQGAPDLWVSSDNVFGREGESVSVQCHYNVRFNTYVKYWCRGEHWRSCQIVRRRDDVPGETDVVSISDDQTQGVFTVTVRRLDERDKGWYWCAIQIVGSDRGARVFLDVAGALSPAPASPTAPRVSSESPAAAPPETPSGSATAAPAHPRQQQTSRPPGAADPQTHPHPHPHPHHSVLAICGSVLLLLLLLCIVSVIVLKRRAGQQKEGVQRSGQETAADPGQTDAMYSTVSFCNDGNPPEQHTVRGAPPEQHTPSVGDITYTTVVFTEGSGQRTQDTGQGAEESAGAVTYSSMAFQKRNPPPAESDSAMYSTITAPRP